MAKTKIGDIFELCTSKGKAYLHYIHKNEITGELLRVLPGLYLERPANFDELAASKERYYISFPLSAAKKQKIVEKVGYYSASCFSKPKYMRTEHYIRGEFLGWYIVNTETWERQLVKILSPEQRKLSPWGIWNDTLLIEKLLIDWKLDDWF